MYDVIVIGAGAVGSSIAFLLSQYNLKVLIIEKNKDVCSETSKANSAIIHGGYDAKPGSLKAKLNVEGNKLHHQLASKFNYEFETIGSLVLAFNEEDEKVLKKLENQAKKNNVSVKIIGQKEAKEIEPELSPKVTKALYCPSAAVINPFNYVNELMACALANKVHLKTDEKVFNIKKDSDHLIVETSKNTYATRYVINAAGLGSQSLIQRTRDDQVEIIPTQGLYRLLARSQQRLNTIVFQTPSTKGKGVLVTRTYAGNTMIGPSSDSINQEMIKDDESLEEISELAKRSIPNINLDFTIKEFLGIRAKPKNGDFLLFESENIPELFHIAGIESPGLTAAPAIAKMSLDWLSKKERLIKKDDFTYLKKDVITDDEIICLCENINRKEIITAINRPPYPATLDALKRKTRATMGPCQGHRCRMKTLNILAAEQGKNKEDIVNELSGFDIRNNFINKKRGH